MRLKWLTRSMRFIAPAASLTVLAACAACAKSAATCPPSDGIALQVLGSGGPIADDARASSAYLVWVDGKSRVMIDAGGGSFLRFGEAGASFADLDFIGLSHFHADHSADFPALLKSGNFSARERSLVVAGPDAGGPFPGLTQYLSSMLDSDTGAYGYLSGYLDGSGGLVKIESLEVGKDDDAAAAAAAAPAVTTVLHQSGDNDDDNRILIDAMHVPHGIVPALGFRVRIDETTIVFSSDQNGSNADFIDFAKAADILVMHMPIPEDATGSALQLHAIPSRLAEIAGAAEVSTLVLSHFMARSLRDLDGNVGVVREGFDGRVLIAEDLSCLSAGPE